VKRLWAPWRLAYIKAPSEPGCIFCAKPAADRDEEHLIVARGRHAFVILNRFPYSSGHVMVIPYRHTADFDSLTPEELADVFRLTQRATAALRSALGARAYNIGMNLGRPAGAGIEEHLHVHIVPRWSGDTNFMPVLADTMVIPQSLEDTYRVLRDAFATPVRPRGSDA